MFEPSKHTDHFLWKPISGLVWSWNSDDDYDSTPQILSEDTGWCDRIIAGDKTTVHFL